MPDGLLGSVEQFASTAASEEAAFGQLNELEEPLSNVRFVAIARQLLTPTLGLANRIVFQLGLHARQAALTVGDCSRPRCRSCFGWPTH